MATLYVVEQGALVAKKGERLLVRKDGKILRDVPLVHVERVVLLGNVHLTTPALVSLLEKGVDVALLSSRGTFRGKIQPPWAKDARLRQQQYAAYQEPERRLDLARRFVVGKLRNMIALWKRQRKCRELGTAVGELQRLARKAGEAGDLAKLRGYEGTAGAIHFRAFRMSLARDLGFRRRAHRPPTDPVNALLSLGYTLLHNEFYALTTMVGLDPYLGFYHEVKHGHPALASDLMEEWRPVVVDFLVLGLINRGELRSAHFRKPRNGIRLTHEGFEIFLKAYERRLTAKVMHPRARERLTYRQCLEAQVRHLAAYLRGKGAAYEPFHWR
jgi:CRISPR-associated protein Cas1